MKIKKQKIIVSTPTIQIPTHENVTMLDHSNFFSNSFDDNNSIINGYMGQKDFDCCLSCHDSPSSISTTTTFTHAHHDHTSTRTMNDHSSPSYERHSFMNHDENMNEPSELESHEYLRFLRRKYGLEESNTNQMEYSPSSFRSSLPEKLFSHDQDHTSGDIPSRPLFFHSTSTKLQQSHQYPFPDHHKSVKFKTFDRLSSNSFQTAHSPFNSPCSSLRPCSKNLNVSLGERSPMPKPRAQVPVPFEKPKFARTSSTTKFPSTNMYFAHEHKASHSSSYIVPFQNDEENPSQSHENAKDTPLTVDDLHVLDKQQQLQLLIEKNNVVDYSSISIKNDHPVSNDCNDNKNNTKDDVHSLSLIEALEDMSRTIHRLSVTSKPERDAIPIHMRKVDAFENEKQNDPQLDFTHQVDKIEPSSCDIQDRLSLKEPSRIIEEQEKEVLEVCVPVTLKKERNHQDEYPITNTASKSVQVDFTQDYVPTTHQYTQTCCNVSSRIVYIDSSVQANMVVQDASTQCLIIDPAHSLNFVTILKEILIQDREHGLSQDSRSPQSKHKLLLSQLKNMDDLLKWIDTQTIHLLNQLPRE